MAKELTVIKKHPSNGSKLLSDGTVVTPIMRAAFVHLKNARSQERDDGTTTESYQICLLGRKGEDLSILINAAQAKIKEKWGNNKPKRFSNPFKKQSDKADEYDGFVEGGVYFNASSKFRPQVVGRNPNEVMDPGDIYSGCWVRCNISFWAWGGEKRHKGNNGVSVNLNKVQFIRDDEPLTGGSKAEEVFDDEADDNDSVDDDSDLL